MSEFKNITASLMKIIEIYTILSSKLLRAKKFLFLCYKGTWPNTSAKHFWGKAVKRIKISLKESRIKVIRGREGVEHLKGVFYSLVTRRHTRAFWTFQSPPVNILLCHFPFVVSFSPIEDLLLFYSLLSYTLELPFFLQKVKNKWQCHLLDTYKISEQTPTTKLISLIFLIILYNENLKVKNVRIYSWLH